MLIIYRTNAGFEGQIQAVDYTTPGPVFDAALQREKNPVTDLAYIELDAGTVSGAAHLDLAANQSAYTVDPSGPSLLCNGVVVYTAPAPMLVEMPIGTSGPVKIEGGPTEVAKSVSWDGAAPIAWL
jgi:hypothetical protein